MKAAIRGIVELNTAYRAHAELAHRRLVTVIGNVLYDRVTWSAVGAVYEWISKSPVLRIEKLAQAVPAGADVR